MVARGRQQWLSVGAGNNSRKNEGTCRRAFGTAASPGRRESTREMEQTQDGISQGSRSTMSCYCERRKDIAADGEQQPGLAEASSSISGKQETGRRAADQQGPVPLSRGSLASGRQNLPIHDQALEAERREACQFEEASKLRSRSWIQSDQSEPACLQSPFAARLSSGGRRGRRRSSIFPLPRQPGQPARRPL